MIHKNTTLLYQKIIGLAGSIPAADLDKLFGLANCRQIRKGEYVLKQGQICSSIAFVEKGLLRSFIEREGLQLNTGFTIENNFTTSLKSLRNSLPSDINIQAGEDSLVYELHKEALFSLYKESPEIASFGRTLLEQLLMEQEEHSNLFKIYTPAGRYQYMLQHRPEIMQRVSLTQLASYLGMARETLSRIRKLK